MNPPAASPVVGSPLAAITCDHCAAPLSVPDDARFVICSHCGSRLEIHRSGGVACTHVLEKIDARTARVEHGLTELLIRERIDLLERQWAIRGGRHIDHSRDGGSVKPAAKPTIIGFIVVIAVGVTIANLAWQPGASPVGAILIASVFVVLAIVLGISDARRAAEFRRAEVRYLQARQTLLDQLKQTTM